MPIEYRLTYSQLEELSKVNLVHNESL